MREKEAVDAVAIGFEDVVLTVVDEQRLGGGQGIAFEQQFVDARFGLHGLLLARNDLAVEKLVDRILPQKGDEFARHVREHVKAVSGRLQVADEPFGSRDRLLEVDGVLQHRSALFIRVAGHFGQRAGHLVECRGAAVVLLPEAWHLRRTQEGEKFEQFRLAFPLVAGEEYSAQIENNILHLCKDNTAGCQMQIFPETERSRPQE